MIRTILFDVDGVIIKLRERYFSEKLIESGIGLNKEAITKFFKNEFLLCEAGKADLKEELEKQIKLWGYPGTTQELMKFWFEGEAELVPEVVSYIKELRNDGIKCFLSTNNEKYRVDYLLNVVGIKDFVDGSFGSAVIGYLKPRQEFWQEVHKRLNNPPKDSILVWDNTNEIADSAREFGFKSEQYKDFAGFKKTMAEYLK